jgi:hypothetical protein
MGQAETPIELRIWMRPRGCGQETRVRTSTLVTYGDGREILAYAHVLWRTGFNSSVAAW